MTNFLTLSLSMIAVYFSQQWLSATSSSLLTAIRTHAPELEPRLFPHRRVFPVSERKGHPPDLSLSAIFGHVDPAFPREVRAALQRARRAAAAAFIVGTLSIGGIVIEVIERAR